MYLVGSVIMFFLLQWTIDWLAPYAGLSLGESTIAFAAAIGALAIGIVMYRNDKYYHLANEVASELKKVTWPTAKEVRAATIVVIVMAIISAAVLGLFDFVWSNLTELVYG
jgi:preprotein translocase subunit SecE